MEYNLNDYGLPDKKKYPMPDASHVKSAIKFFNYVSEEDEAELAKNIIKKAKKFGVPIRCGTSNRLFKYITKEIAQEGFISEDMYGVINGTLKQHLAQGDFVKTDKYPYVKKKKKGEDDQFIAAGMMQNTVFAETDNFTKKVVQYSLGMMPSAFIVYYTQRKMIKQTIKNSKTSKEAIEKLTKLRSKFKAVGTFRTNNGNVIPFADKAMKNYMFQKNLSLIDKKIKELKNNPHMLEFLCNDIDENDNILESFNEARDIVKYNKNFKKLKSDINFKYMDIKNPNIDKYLNSDSYCRKYKEYIKNESVGELVIDKDNNKVAGYVFVYDSRSESKGFIWTLNVNKKYRGYGIGSKLIKDAINKYSGIDLVVYRDNKVALDMYKKNGFIIIGNGNEQDGSDYWMKLKSLNESCFEEEGNISSKELKDISTRICDKSEKDSKGPTGNQNCMLCTWCAEAQIRGYKKLPRAVYSPRDIIFQYNGYDIVKNPRKQKISDKNNVKDIVTKSGNNSRYYIHVNWKNSTSGHEFMLVNINNKVYILDPQAGLFSGIDTKNASHYFDNINYNKSYLVRLDNKELNKDMLKFNNKSNITKWNEEEDIKYMKRHRMIESNCNELFNFTIDDNLCIEESCESVLNARNFIQDAGKYGKKEDCDSNSSNIPNYRLKEYYSYELSDFVIVANLCVEELENMDNMITFTKVDIESDDGGYSFIDVNTEDSDRIVERLNLYLKSSMYYEYHVKSRSLGNGNNRLYLFKDEDNSLVQEACVFTEDELRMAAEMCIELLKKWMGRLHIK